MDPATQGANMAMVSSMNNHAEQQGSGGAGIFDFLGKGAAAGGKGMITIMFGNIDEAMASITKIIPLESIANFEQYLNVQGQCHLGLFDKAFAGVELTMTPGEDGGVEMGLSGEPEGVMAAMDAMEHSAPFESVAMPGISDAMDVDMGAGQFVAQSTGIAAGHDRGGDAMEIG